jgi:hypothetical protein
LGEKIIVRDKPFFSASSENSRISRQRQGPEPDGGQDELHQGVAVLAGLRGLAFCRQVQIIKK